MAQQLPPGAEKEQAVTWLSDVSPKDVAAVGNRFDAWLRKISGNHITFEDVKTFAGAVPIIGNIMAMVDALGDIAEIIEKRGGQVLDYMSLAINLLGIIPVPPTLAPFRMSARPLLALVRHELLMTRNNLGAAIISVLVTHINATCATEIEDFLNKLKSGLVELLNGCASTCQELMLALATGMDKALHGQLFDANANLKRQQEIAKKMADDRPWYSPSRVGDGIQFAYEGTQALGKKVVNKTAGTVAKLAPDAWLEPFRGTVTFLRTEAPKIAASIRSLAGSEEGKMMWLVLQLIEAVGRVKARAKLHEQSTDVKANGKSQAKKTREQEGLEKVDGQAPVEGAGRSTCKACGLGASEASIDFAFGDETFSHVDFDLPGAMPLVWERTYRSRLSAYDNGELGARWITPYTTRIDIKNGQWIYRDAEGRSIEYPALAAGAVHDDLSENLTLSRLDDTWVTIAYGHAVLHVYERRGDVFRLAMQKDRAGNTITLDYDALDRLARLIDSSGNVLAFEHDRHGRIVQIEHVLKDGVRRTLASYEYDADGDHEYDELGNRRRTVRPDGHAVDWLMYGSGHVHGMLLDGEERVQFERDDLHRETVRVLSSKVGQRTHYDPAGRVLQQTIQRSTSPAPLAERRYRYDVVGQLSRIEDSRKGGTDYRYDPVGRLIEAISPIAKERFAFDPASNIIDPVRTADMSASRPSPVRPESTLPVEVPKGLGNLLKAYAGMHFEYDARGNLVRKRTPAGEQEYEWDEFNRLLSARVAETSRQSQARYFYDPFGRRIAKEVNGERTVFGWDGDTLAYESDGERGTHYLYEPGTFVPLAQYVAGPVEGIVTPEWESTDRYVPEEDPLQKVPERRGDAAVFYYHCDQIGTPQLLTDADGDVVWEASYKAWGEAREVIARVSKAAGIVARNPLRFQGQQDDEETGLHYNRYRYYDPEVGRFISKDPIGLAGGLNAFQYAPNPIGWVDPLGLRCDSPAEKLRRKLSALEGAQATADRTRALPDGRIRYYDKEALARTAGPTRGRSHVTEWNPATGQVRSWEETYDHSGAVNRVHPKMNDGEVLDLPHYPPTKADIDQGKATPGGRAINCPCRC